MSEERATYETAADTLAEMGYVQEAVEMLSKGYEPSIEIEAPQTVTKRRGRKFTEEERPAFVKIYTSFKDELKELDGDDLKVWLYLALSVNRHTGDARPGLRRIAEETGMAVNTVRLAIGRLEEKGLLDVEKADGKHSHFRPSDYVSARKGTVSNFDTPRQTVSKNAGTVSKNKTTVSVPRKDFAQPEEPEEPEQIDITPDPVFVALENLKGGLNTDTPRYVDTWREKHTDEWILKAISITKEKGAGVRYADSILIGWEANGYPKSRDELVSERKTPASNLPKGAAVAASWLAKKQEEAVHGN